MKTLELTDFRSDRKEYLVVEKITHWQHYEEVQYEELEERLPARLFGLVAGDIVKTSLPKGVKTGSLVALEGGVRTIVQESPAEIAKLLSPRKLNMKKGAKNG